MTLYVQASGSPATPAVVFLHGFGVSSWMWTEQVASLSKDYYCLAVDLPGNGESYQSPWHSMKDSASQVAAVIRERVPSQRAHIVGLSLGGYVTLHLLRDHPEVVETAIVSGLTTQPLRPRWRMKLLTYFMQPFLQSPVGVFAMSRMMALPPEAVEYYRRDTARLKRETFFRVYDEVFEYNLVAHFGGRIQRRLLGVAGDLEAKMVTRDLPSYGSLGDCATAVVSAAAHHGWNAEHPERFTDMIRAWITDQPFPTGLTLVQPPVPV